MLHERALDLEGTNEVTGGLDHVVAAPDEPEPSVIVSTDEIAGQVPAAGEAPFVARGLVEVAAEHRGPTGAQGQLALCVVADLDRVAACIEDSVAVVVALDDRRVDARQRASHRARTQFASWEVGDHDPARLGLPPVVVNRPAEHLGAPQHRFGVERLSHAGDEAQRAQVVLGGELVAGTHRASGSRSEPCTRP